ncbi:hypothetical protein JZX87_06175 [Agrobacterium sp. Ap1]|uniref:hypothetical protein n=1 Tax=Agrobacterium sp. Ap1 TaxID=2815337 RepID=UPI0011D047B3|nr:hypothetical protein [Agrobacterium sp. Ap1]MBO0140755.1 hypothetical protein [Agrobacterium sp. Ap1]
MDSENLSPALLRAGQEYLASLRRLRLNPEGLLWARVNETQMVKDSATGMQFDAGGLGEWHLVLVTGAIDEAGPSALNELLFKAYDASATPKEISPFIVEVMSAKSPFVSQLLIALNNPVGPIAITSGTTGGKSYRQDIDPYEGQQMVAGLWFDRKWIYHLTGLHARHAERKRSWKDFKQSVNALAA